MFVFVALQDKKTVDEFPDALDGESHLEDRDGEFNVYCCSSPIFFCTSLLSIWFNLAMLPVNIFTIRYLCCVLLCWCILHNLTTLCLSNVWTLGSVIRFYLRVYDGEALVQRSVSVLETWKKLLYVHPHLPHPQLIGSREPEEAGDRERRGTDTQGIRSLSSNEWRLPYSHGATKAHRHVEPYLLIKDDMEGKSIAESFLVHPQLARVTWTEGAMEAAWEVNETHQCWRS